LNLLIELWQLTRSRNKRWLFPLIVICLMAGALALFTSSSAVAPFIYTLF
jgi:hypothetical protein